MSDCDFTDRLEALYEWRDHARSGGAFLDPSACRAVERAAGRLRQLMRVPVQAAIPEQRQVALLLAKDLSDSGLRVIMTREDDILPTLQQRADIANAAFANLFVSVHNNAAGDPEVSDRVQAVRTTAERLDADREVSGLPTLAKLIGEDDATKVSELLGLRKSKPAPTAGPDVLPLTDLGNGERFARDHAGKVVYTRTHGWLVWDGSRWADDDTGLVRRLAATTARRIHLEAASAHDAQQAERISRWAVASESRRKLDDAVNVASNLDGIVSRIDAFDADPWSLNVKNGVLDLRTGTLAQADPTRRLTKLAPVVYDPKAKAPTWERFLDRIFAGNVRMIDFVQEAAGYSATGDTGAQCFFMLYGSGANGKTTFLEAVRFVLGDYAAKLDDESLLLSARGQGNASLSEMARLVGARFVSASETPEGRRANEALIKDLTGGSPIVAKLLYREPFEFKPVLKLWVDTNHLPRVGDLSPGFWRRVHLIPFVVQIPEAERDARLPEKLADEASGILNWLVEGCLRWQKAGRLVAPQEVTQATSNYRNDMDSVALWIDEECELQADGEVQSSLAYRSYEAWCRNSGLFPLGSRRFSENMTNRGIRKERRKNGRFFVGITLAVEDSNPWDGPPAPREPGEDDDDETPAMLPFEPRPADEPRPNSPEDLGVHKTKEDEGGTCAECGSTGLHTLPMNGVRLCRVHWYAKAGAKPPEFSR